MKIYIDGELPKSCASCQFLVHCDQCEGTENYCPFVGCVGYDPSDTLINGAPITPTGERHEECPLEQRPHGEWEKYGDKIEAYDISGIKTWGQKRRCTNCGFIHTYIEDFGFYSICPNCGSDNRKRKGDEK